MGTDLVRRNLAAPDHLHQSRTRHAKKAGGRGGGEFPGNGSNRLGPSIREYLDNVFRSVAGLAVEPRAYQYVPLMLALRQDVTRLVIADDVGILVVPLV